MEFDITGALSLKYRCGGLLAVWFVDLDGEVERLMRVLGWDEKTRRSVVEVKGREQATNVPLPSASTRETE